MAGDECVPMKLKRKDIDRVNDDFSDISLSSPARKIRRLDADLPPIMEEEEADMPVIEELGPEPVNQERAIVLFKPAQPQQPSSGSIFVDSNLISGFKSQFLRSSYSSNTRQVDNENDENKSINGCRAVVPWIPSHVPPTQTTELFQQSQNCPEIIQPNTMSDEMMGEETMEIDDDNSCNISAQQDQFTRDFGVARGSEGLPQWQQHCAVPQPPQNISTPITWFQ